jgi:hypothetical protein
VTGYVIPVNAFLIVYHSRSKVFETTKTARYNLVGGRIFEGINKTGGFEIHTRQLRKLNRK